MQYFYVKNWRRFQHYKHRNPPWVKLHCEIFTSADWVALADASKLLAIVCIVVASRNEGRVPSDPAFLKRIAYLDHTPNLKPLIDCGFLSKTLADDSESKQLRTNADPEYRVQSSERKIDDDTSAKTSSISEEAFEIAKEITLLVGHDPEFVPPAWHGAPYKIQTWLSGGWPRDAILTSAKIQMEARGTRKAPTTVQYFEKGIADFIESQSQPLPTGEHNGSSHSNGRSKNGYGKTRDDAILAGMGRIADRLVRDRETRRQGNLLPDERAAETRTSGTDATGKPTIRS